MNTSVDVLVNTLVDTLVHTLVHTLVDALMGAPVDTLATWAVDIAVKTLVNAFESFCGHSRERSASVEKKTLCHSLATPCQPTAGLAGSPCPCGLPGHRY